MLFDVALDAPHMPFDELVATLEILELLWDQQFAVPVD